MALTAPLSLEATSFFSPAYSEALPTWTLCRDAIEGQDAVKAKTTQYLPTLKDQSELDYAAYIQRTYYYNATGKTAAAVVGMATRKPAQIKADESDDISKKVKNWFAGVDLQGNTLVTFGVEVMKEAVALGRVGILVDYVASKKGDTLAQAKKRRNTPYLVAYKAEEIVNWRTIEGKLDMVMVTEREYTNPFDYTEYKDTILMLYIDETSNKYQQARYITVVNPETTTETWELEGPPIIPRLDNKPLKEIPFYFAGDIDIEEPPLLDLAHVNIAHYQQMADYKHLLHYSAIPTLVITGVQSKDPVTGVETQIKIGSENAIVLSNSEANAEWIKAGSDGSEPIRNELLDLQNRMASLGVSLVDERIDRETAQAAVLRNSYNTASLVTIVRQVNEAMSKALTVAAKWLGMNVTVLKYQLPVEFNTGSIDAQTIAALVAAYQSGTMSLETLLSIFERGELYGDLPVQVEMKRIKDSPPPILPISGAAGGATPTSKISPSGQKPGAVKSPSRTTPKTVGV